MGAYGLRLRVSYCRFARRKRRARRGHAWFAANGAGLPSGTATSRSAGVGARGPLVADEDITDLRGATGRLWNPALLRRRNWAGLAQLPRRERHLAADRRDARPAR